MDALFGLLEKLLDVVRSVTSWFTSDRRKVLPQSDVALDSFTKDGLSVDLRVGLRLEKETSHDVEAFLRRLKLGEPYCATCQWPLDDWNADWMADFAQIGYQCSDCETQIRGDRSHLVKDVKADIRRDFDRYRGLYKAAVDRLTGGKPHRYRVPH